MKLAEAYGIKGIYCDQPSKLEEAIIEMLEHKGPVLFNCVVEKHENCFPMIPSGKAHNEMILDGTQPESSIEESGAVLV